MDGQCLSDSVRSKEQSVFMSDMSVYVHISSCHSILVQIPLRRYIDPLFRFCIHLIERPTFGSHYDSLRRRALRLRSVYRQEILCHRSLMFARLAPARALSASGNCLGRRRCSSIANIGRLWLVSSHSVSCKSRTRVFGPCHIALNAVTGDSTESLTTNGCAYT